MSNSVIVTFIRHAQSTDNNRAMWTGWKDAPLSYNGMLCKEASQTIVNGIHFIFNRVNQARTLGESLADTHFTAIYTSDLQRASATAQALYDHQKDPSRLLIRQTFSVNKTLASLSETDVIRCHYDDGRFLGGESIKGMAERARTGLEQFVFPHVWQAAKGETGVHVAVVSHGLCITELVSELFKKSAKQVKKPEDISLSNTGWIRVVVDIEGVQEGQPIDVDKERPALAMRITQVEGRHYGY
ncbi:phosphoglycerate mutase-like protein [Lactarius hengduanensis]|nr:phosphoglycerate mutase-like protein [Lactarius hengduanensis]